MKIWKKIWHYLTFKKDTDAAGNFNLKMMHGINKISIMLFLFGMIVLATKCMTN